MSGVETAAGRGSRLQRWKRRSTRVGAFLDHRFAFRSAANIVTATCAMMLVCALTALFLGQDTNWDLRNYHLYNAYALLHGRVGVDLAPAQMQSYFNPLLDLLHYGLLMHWPPVLGAMALAAFHGLLLPLVAYVAWQVLPADRHRPRLASLLGLAGLCSAAFLSELGGTMADNTTAVFVVSALALVLSAQQRQRGTGSIGALPWLLAGAALGIAVACKLTNGVYAIALGLAALAGGGKARMRIGGMLLMVLAALVVFALLAGPWLWTMWQSFGNPLFPQFNHWFHSPLASPLAVGDTRWLPRSWGERLAWPLVFTANPYRVSEIALLQCIWAVLYLLALALIVKAIVRRARGLAVGGTPAPAALRTVLVFFVAGYVIWQAVFSIHRYLVALEVLAPLLLWIGMRKLLAPSVSCRWAAGAVAFCALVSVVGWNDWGHGRWTGQAFEVAAPDMPRPADSAVLLVGGEPQAWRIPFLPPDAVYAAVASNFPEAEGYRARIDAILGQRSDVFAMIPATVDRKAGRMLRINRWVARLGLSHQPGCAALRWLEQRGLKMRVDESEGQCRLQARPGSLIDVPAADGALARTADSQLAAYGLALDPASCRTMPARIGQDDFPYQWCRARRR